MDEVVINCYMINEYLESEGKLVYTMTSNIEHIHKTTLAYKTRNHRTKKSGISTFLFFLFFIFYF